MVPCKSKIQDVCALNCFFSAPVNGHCTNFSLPSLATIGFNGGSDGGGLDKLSRFGCFFDSQLQLFQINNRNNASSHPDSLLPLADYLGSPNVRPLHFKEIWRCCLDLVHRNANVPHDRLCDHRLNSALSYLQRRCMHWNWEIYCLAAVNPADKLLSGFSRPGNHCFKRKNWRGQRRHSIK